LFLELYVKLFTILFLVICWCCKRGW